MCYAGVYLSNLILAILFVNSKYVSICLHEQTLSFVHAIVFIAIFVKLDGQQFSVGVQQLQVFDELNTA